VTTMPRLAAATTLTTLSRPYPFEGKAAFFEGVTYVSPFVYRGTFSKPVCGADLAR